MGENSLLGPRLLLVTSRPAACRVELVFGQGVEQSDSLQLVAARIVPGLLLHTALVDGLLHRTHDKVSTELLHQVIPVGDGLRKIVTGVDMYQRERNLGRIKGLVCQISQHNGILSAREQDARPLELCSNLPQDIDGLGFKLLQMS